MRRVLLVVLSLMLSAAAAFGQGGSVGIFADQQGVGCALGDPVNTVASYHVVHVYASNVTAAQFSAPKPACFTGTYLSDTAIYPVTIGNSQVGISMGYGTCMSSPIHILTINYFTYGTTAPCCQYPVLPDPNASPYPNIWTVDCDFNLLAAGGRAGVINMTPDCMCVGATPVEDSTWGHVKALFGE